MMRGGEETWESERAWGLVLLTLGGLALYVAYLTFEHVIGTYL